MWKWTAFFLVLCGLSWGQGPDLEAKRRAAVERAQAFLIKHQNTDGSWGSARNTKELNIYAPVPGAHRSFKAACTSLCILALLDTDQKRAKPQLQMATRWLFANLPKVKRGSPYTIYSIWAHAYSIQALLKLVDSGHLSFFQKRAARKHVRSQIRRLQMYETIHGGWAYYNFGPITARPSSWGKSFVSSAILIALSEAQDREYELPQKMIGQAVRSVARQQKPDKSYLYGEDHRYRPTHPANMPGGSLGRSQVCNHALHLWNHKSITINSHCLWLDRLFARGGWLDQGRKRPVPHESWFSVAGYYYYFAYYYASRNILLLPKDKQHKYRAQLVSQVIKHQEKDGSWWDFPLYDYHKYYGTAFALISLQNCRLNAGKP